MQKKISKLMREFPTLLKEVNRTKRDSSFVISLESHYAMRKLHILTGGYSTDLIARYLYPSRKKKTEWIDGIDFLGNFKTNFNVERLKQLPCFARKFGVSPGNAAAVDEVLRLNPGIARIDVSEPELYADYDTVRFITGSGFEHRARDILGVQPCAVNLSAWWSFPTDSGPAELSAAAQMWHRDIDHLSEIKFFCFATNVSLDNGPFQFVKGSHLSTLRNCSTTDGRLSEHWILKNVCKENIFSVRANAGDVFVVDTHGLHRGCPVLAGRRLVLQLHFSYSIFGAELLARPRIKLDRKWASFELWAEALQRQPNVWRYLFDQQSLKPFI